MESKEPIKIFLSPRNRKKVLPVIVVKLISSDPCRGLECKKKQKRFLSPRNKQAISAREWALCQLTVCFEFQSRSDRKKRTQKLCPGNGVQKERKKVTVKV